MRHLLRPAFLLLLATLCAGGCAVGPCSEKGEYLRRETRLIGVEPEFVLRGVESLERDPPVLTVWVDRRDRTQREFRRIYRKVQVTGRRRPSFEPRFFLWPVNVIRTPLGLAGAAFSTADWVAHYLAGGVGAAVGIAVTSTAYPYLGIAHGMRLVEVTDPSGFGTAAAFTRITVGLLETVLLPFDALHAAVHGTPVYPILAETKEFPTGWAQAVSDSWHFAWAWQSYPPLPVWYRTEEVREELPGQVLKEGWVRDDVTGDWYGAGIDTFRLIYGGRSRTAHAVAGPLVINLRRVAGACGAADLVRLTVEADTGAGVVCREFEFPTERLLAR